MQKIKCAILSRFIQHDNYNCNWYDILEHGITLNGADELVEYLASNYIINIFVDVPKCITIKD